MELIVVVYRWASGKGALQFDKTLYNTKTAAKGFRATAILMQREGKPLRGVSHSAGCRVTALGLVTWTLKALDLPHCIVLVSADLPQKLLLEYVERSQINERVQVEFTLMVSQEDNALAHSEGYHGFSLLPGILGPILPRADGAGPRVGYSRNSWADVDLDKPGLSASTIECSRARCAAEDHNKHGFIWSSEVVGAVVRAKLRGKPMPPTQDEQRIVQRNGSGPALPTVCPFIWEAING
ncbi:g12970 [Coccomyxa viridis]|uniref:G12970 protein n=1 Tax=Coccomyxa viridis TaxID=1274662 RepID=A0ABP1GBM4_9CHLO